MQGKIPASTSGGDYLWSRLPVELFHMELATYGALHMDLTTYI